MLKRVGIVLWIALLAAGGCYGAGGYNETKVFKMPDPGFTAEPATCAEKCKDQLDFFPFLPEDPPFEDGNFVNAWSVILLNQVKEHFKKVSPPGIGRVLAIFSTCLYDAATLFNDDWEPAYFKEGGSAAGDIFALKEVLSGAAFSSIKNMFQEFDSFSKVEEFFNKVSPKGMTENALKGKEACEAVLKAFEADGFDTLGRAKGDPTEYEPVNKPQTTPGKTDCQAEIDNLDKWQPLCVPVEYKSKRCNVQGFLAPWAGSFTTFSSINTSDVVKTTGPPKVNKGNQEEWLTQAREVLEYSGKLNDSTKIIAEYWADGPDSTAPPGHWFEIALLAAKAKSLSTLDTIRLLLVVGNAANDAGAASWAMKYRENFIRPLQMIQCGLGEVGNVSAWIGPYQGIGTIDPADWQPYQAADFVTPPFAGWVSGHSTFSAAGAEALRLFFDTDKYIGPPCFVTKKGDSNFEPKRVKGDEFYEEGVTDVPNEGPKTKGYVPAKDVVLCWETFSEAAQQAGISRLHGGIHIMADHVDGNVIGKKVAEKVYERAKKLWGQT